MMRAFEGHGFEMDNVERSERMGAQEVWELSGGWKVKEARKTKARNSGVRKLERVRNLGSEGRSHGVTA